MLAGTEENTAKVHDFLAKEFIVKDRGVLGPEKHHIHEIEFLHTVCRWGFGSDTITCEADPKHA